VTLANVNLEGTPSLVSGPDSLAETSSNDVVDTISAQDQIGSGDSSRGRISVKHTVLDQPCLSPAYR